MALLAALAGPATARADAPAPPAAAEPAGIGLDLELSYASAYVFRGANVFSPASQWEQFGLVAPSVTWAIGDTGLSLGYWGGFQINGEVAANIDAGLGCEQDLSVKYETHLSDALSVSLAILYYFYPFADAQVAGTSVPSYLEPALGLAYSGVLDAGLNVSYMAGLQVPLRASRYLYVNPTVGKTFQVTGRVGLDLAAGFGYKRFNRGPAVQDNGLDVLLSVRVPVALRGKLRVTPSLSAAWTNFADRDVGQEWVVFGGLTVGTSL